MFSLDMFPVGSIIENALTDFDPNIYYGGDWELFATGQVTVGAGTNSSGKVWTCGDSGGSETHTLTIEEMAEHNHVIDSTTLYGDVVLHASGTGTHVADVGGVFYATFVNSRYQSPTTLISGANSVGTYSINASHSHSMQNIGSSTPFSIMQPYAVVNRWVRVA